VATAIRDTKTDRVLVAGGNQVVLAS